jgi:hypothetical protein
VGQELIMSNDHQTNPVGRVAVVAIHGVADQQPGNTAHRISNLLLMHRADAYTGFVQSDLRIGVQAVHLGPRSAEEAQGARNPNSLKGRLAKEFQMSPRAKSVHRAQQQAIQRAQTGASAAPSDNFQHSYMREQLEEYRPEGKDAVYETIRLAGARLSASTAQEIFLPPDRRDVHVFEMYWADLSRAAGGLRRLVTEFYLLLFFLCSLGRHSIEFARVSFAKPQQAAWWRRFAQCQLIAEDLLVLGLPILNLCLLGLGVAMLPKHLDPQYHLTALNLIVGALAISITGVALYLTRLRLFVKLPWPASITVLAAGSALIYFAFQWIFSGWKPLVLLAALGWTLAASAILWMMRAYQKRKPGAFLLSGIAVLLVSATLFAHPSFTRDTDVHGILDAIMFATEASFAALCLCWLCFSLCYWGVCVAGYFAVKSVKADGEDALAAARRVRWTVHLTLVVPAVVVALANVVLWQALLTLTWRLIPDDGNYYVPVLLAHWIHPTSLVMFTHKMVQLTAGPYFTSAYLLLAVATLIFLWALLPVLLSELRVPTRKETEWLGACLDRAYKAAFGPGLALAGVVGLTPILYALTFWDPHYDKLWPEWVRQNPGRMLAVVGSALLLIVLGSKLPFKAPGKVLRNVLDIALDITNWLRLNPKQTNPKARISARFVSLLRHIHNWRDPEDGRAYSGLVIIAHSQGTVIAAEVLRFIAEEAKAGGIDPLLKGFGENIPIYLFTMGSPLRQLYSLRFPHHYGWARHQGETAADRLPDPQSLQVRKWVNVYRSADYVGRHLWRDDTGTNRWQIEKDELGTHRREWCIGAGAHNHYWDETAEGVAEELDNLIVEAGATAALPDRGTFVTRGVGI